MKVILLLLALSLGFAAGPARGQSAPADQTFPALPALGKWDRKLAWAFKNKISGIRVTCSGKVVYKLPDDTLDIRHQRFLIKLESGQTLLIVHNIDLAKRVKPLRRGDKITARGEYVWNDKGGLVHLTHDDPNGVLPGGWIKHRGIVYH